jgi:hypothetical protein
LSLVLLLIGCLLFFFFPSFTFFLYLEGESFLVRFVAEGRPLSWRGRGELLAAAQEVREAHDGAALDSANQSEAPAAEAEIDHHFVCFLPKNGKLYELDGGKASPICHGETTESSFLSVRTPQTKKKTTSSLVGLPFLFNFSSFCFRILPS